jgi:osmotically-inducible protein OsmY
MGDSRSADWATTGLLGRKCGVPAARETFDERGIERTEIVLMESEGMIVRAGLQRLRESPYSAVRRLSCEFAGGVLTLRGNVASFFHKQVAQQSVAGLEGVDQVDNQVNVK